MWRLLSEVVGAFVSPYFTVLYAMSCTTHSVLVIKAKQLQRHFVLLRQGPGSRKQFGAIKVVEVISYDHLNSSGTAHGSIDSLEGSDWTLVSCLTWGDFQFHIMHLIT